MAKYVNIEFEDEEEYERLSRRKDKHGLTWRGMLLRAEESLKSE